MATTSLPNIGVYTSENIGVEQDVDGVASVAFNSAQTGMWTDPDTWTEDGVPGIGDTVTIATGHTVTVPTGAFVTVGHSPGESDSTPAINIIGDLVMSDNSTLYCRGDLDLADGNLTAGAGCIWKFDTTAAATPSTAFYRFRSGTAISQSSLITFTGTEDNRSSFLSDSGGANAYSEAPASGTGNYSFTYTDITGIGDGSTRKAFRLYSCDVKYVFVNCRFDDCGLMDGNTNMTATGIFQMTDNNFKNSLGTLNVQVRGLALTSGTREFLRNACDLRVDFFVGNDFTVEDNYITRFSCTGGDLASFQNNVILNTGVVMNINTSSIVNSLFLSNVAANSHFMRAQSGDLSTLSITGCLYQNINTSCDGQGDMILPPAFASGLTASISNCIGLPSSNSTPTISGTMVTLGGGANTTAVIDHCTYYASDNGAINFAETYGGHTNMVTSIRSNLALTIGGGEGYIAREVGTGVANMVTVAGYNARETMTGSYDSTAGVITSEGSNDQTGIDPDLVHPFRRIEDWDDNLNGPGTSANAVAELAKMNDSDWDTNYNPQAVITYLKAGYSPRNQALESAGHDGEDIGAIDVTVPAVLALPIPVRHRVF